MDNRSIVKSIYIHSQQTPDKTAIIATDYTVSYRSLWNAILQNEGGIQNPRNLQKAL